MTKGLRVLVVTQYFWPENFQINHLVRGLVERGHEVEVLTGKPNYPSGRFFPGYGVFTHSADEFAGANVIRAPLVPRGRGGGVRLAINYLTFAFAAAALVCFRLRGPFDVIFVYEPSPITVALPAILARRRFKAPLILWVQDLWPASVVAAAGVRSRVVVGFLNRLVRFIYRRCDSILVQSEAFRANVEACGGAPNKIGYFPQSVDALFRPVEPGEALKESSLLPSGFRVMFAGNIGEAQDMPTLIEAATALRNRKDIHWIVIGDGRRYEWLAKEVEARGLASSVHLLGRYPEESMPRFFALADALLVTLKKEPIFALTIPTKIQAYLASGRPIVAGLDGEGARIIEAAGAGLTAPAGDPKALSEAVTRLADLSSAERAGMSARGLSYSLAHFDRNTLLNELEAHFTALRVAKG